MTQDRWSSGFVDWYLVPMGSAIWSADPATFTNFPAVTFARFFDNHGLLRLGDQPQWRTVVGGSASYVEAITRPLGRRLRLSTTVSKVVRRDDGIEVATDNGDLEHFDHVIVATHSDQALRLLSDPTPDERQILGAIGYRPNLATLHTDGRLLPRRKRARASWNWHRQPGAGAPTLTYDLGRLQGLSSPVADLSHPQSARRRRSRPGDRDDDLLAPGVRPGGHARRNAGTPRSAGTMACRTAAPTGDTGSTRTGHRAPWRYAASSVCRGRGRRT